MVNPVRRKIGELGMRIDRVSCRIAESKIGYKVLLRQDGQAVLFPQSISPGEIPCVDLTLVDLIKNA